MKTPVDRLEEFLSECGHQTWGFVIYRVVYDSSSGDNFASFLSNIKASASQSLEFYGADEWPIAQQISWTVVEDHALDGASKVEVRRSFDEWCQSAEAASEQPSSRHPIAQSYTARYRFCVVIDRSSLDSAETRKPWVNVIMRNWPLTQRVGPGSGDEVGEEEEGEDVSLESDAVLVCCVMFSKCLVLVLSATSHRGMSENCESYNSILAMMRAATWA